MEFSPAIYKRLLDFYEDKLEVSRDQQLHWGQEEILHQVACQWLNAKDDWQDRKNYEIWTNNGLKKKELKIVGIFPITGQRYTAPELLPGEF